jgi:hypothetical protein
MFLRHRHVVEACCQFLALGTSLKESLDTRLKGLADNASLLKLPTVRLALCC